MYIWAFRLLANSKKRCMVFIDLSENATNATLKTSWWHVLQEAKVWHEHSFLIFLPLNQWNKVKKMMRSLRVNFSDSKSAHSHCGIFERSIAFSSLVEFTWPQVSKIRQFHHKKYRDWNFFAFFKTKELPTLTAFPIMRFSFTPFMACRPGKCTKFGRAFGSFEKLNLSKKSVKKNQNCCAPVPVKTALVRTLSTSRKPIDIKTWLLSRPTSVTPITNGRTCTWQRSKRSNVKRHKRHRFQKKALTKFQSDEMTNDMWSTKLRISNINIIRFVFQ